jgi:tRNA pseudouridine32 synthase/23S rRNA pseudouridine746 synthase
LSSACIDLIYQDSFLLVVNKPAGLLSVPGRGADMQNCLSTQLQQQFPDALVVHRLDMATSGLMLFALSTVMQRQLSLMFSERQIGKGYIAVVQGKMESSAGEINLPISADWPNRPMQKISTEQGKPSLTRYRMLSNNNESSRVELEPVTGRTHQLRVHLAAIGHPILGDALYGDVSTAPRLLLHACALSFVHPISGQALNFLAVPPF